MNISLDPSRKTPPPPHFEIDTLDYIPIVSRISGLARQLLGLGQTIVGIATFPFELAERARVSGNENPPFLAALGISNMIRGSIAKRQIRGNIALYLYDHCDMKEAVQRDFGIREETLQKRRLRLLWEEV